MIGQRAHGLLRLLLTLQVLAAGALFIVMFFAMETVQGRLSPEVRERYPIYLGLVVLSLAIGGRMAALDRERWHGASLDLGAARRATFAAKQTGVAAATLFLFLVATKDAAISRSFLFLFIALLYPVLLVMHITLPRRLAKWFFGDNPRDATLLAGPADLARELAGWLNVKRTLGIKAVGRIGPPVPAAEEGSVPWLGGYDCLERIIEDHGIQRILLLGAHAAEETGIAEFCERIGIRILVYNDLETRMKRPLLHFHDDGRLFAALRREPLDNPFHRAVKRAFDLAISLPVVALILPPLTLFVWVLQRIQSPGPVFHRQIRSGLQNRSFEILKFRTMHIHNAPEDLQACAQDARVYPAARWLRRYSLDEFPQFLNVLRSEMSLIGPRPHLPEHNRRFSELTARYNGRAWIKPGITGLAQVRGFRGEIVSDSDLRARVESDFEYLENWSLSLDVAIFFRTLGQLAFPPRQAY